jgi:DNA modification methylase
LYLYDSLALHGNRVLKAGGSLVTYAGHYAISKIIQCMEARNLDYYWIFSVVHTGPFSSIFAKNILVKWKPLLWFVKGKREKPYEKIFDLINSTKPDKILHSCEQSPEEARYIINQLTQPGDTVFDPFMGSGTTGTAAIKLKRKFVGIEIDKGVLEIAKRNLSSVIQGENRIVQDRD